MVTVEYAVSREKEEAFLKAMAALRKARLRTGAVQWWLFRDAESPHRLTEFFVVDSWDEHLRQHNDRLTGIDREIEALVESLAKTPSVTKHYLAVEED
jgi:quinol monooxygenase YgiN